MHPPQTPPGEGSARILGASIQALVRIGRPSSENPSQHSTGARTPLLRVGGDGTLSCGGGGRGVPRPQLTALTANETGSVRVQHVPSCRGHWLPPHSGLPCPGMELGCWHQLKPSGERPLGPPPPGHSSLTSVSTARMGPDEAVVPARPAGPC